MLAISLALTGLAQTAQAAPKPNLLFMMADQVGAAPFPRALQPSTTHERGQKRAVYTYTIA